MRTRSTPSGRGHTCQANAPPMCGEHGIQSVIYLASPYTHSVSSIREARFDAACLATAALIRAGRVVFSPIVHGHPLVRFGLPIEWDFWQQFDCEHLKRCDELVVLTLDGWRESRGVQAEMSLAMHMQLPVRYMTPMQGG